VEQIPAVTDQKPHRVYARYLGKTAFVNRFAEATEAAKLYESLRRRYARHRATFVIIQENIPTSVKWADMRVCLLDGVATPGETTRS
jgi:hypothetical protein